LHTERGHVKAKLTSFKTYLLSNQTTITEIKRRQGKVDDIFDAIEDLGDTEVEQAEHAAFEDYFYALLGQADEHLLKKGNVVTCVESNHTSNIHVKLPLLQLPEFTGNYLEWTSN